MKGIVLASHGLLADGMLDTIKMFSGEPSQIESLCLLPGQEMNEYLSKLIEATTRVDQGDGVVIFCDLLFGTPCNCSAYFLKDKLENEKVTVVTGMNLPMVLEYVSAREHGMEIESVITTGQDGIKNFNELYQARNQ